VSDSKEKQQKTKVGESEFAIAPYRGEGEPRETARFLEALDQAKEHLVAPSLLNRLVKAGVKPKQLAIFMQTLIARRQDVADMYGIKKASVNAIIRQVSKVVPDVQLMRRQVMEELTTQCLSESLRAFLAHNVSDAIALTKPEALASSMAKLADVLDRIRTTTREVDATEEVFEILERVTRKRTVKKTLPKQNSDTTSDAKDTTEQLSNVVDITGEVTDIDSDSDTGPGGADSPAPGEHAATDV